MKIKKYGTSRSLVPMSQKESRKLALETRLHQSLFPLLFPGTGHIVPQTVAGRSFCMLSALFGIPLYALFLKCAGDLVINVLRKAIRVAERTELVDVKYMNIKIMVLAFVSMTAVILIGALGSFSFGWSYFEGKSTSK